MARGGVQRVVRHLGLLLALALPALAQDGLPPPARREPSKVRGLVFRAPEGWLEAAPIEPERAAWTIGPPGGPVARVTVTRLGTSKRSVDQHVARWTRAFEGEDGEPLAPARARKDVVEVEGIAATLVHLTGTWVAVTEPGAEERVRRPGWAALHAVLDGPEGQSVVSLVGPADLVLRQRDALVAFVKATTIGSIAADPEPPPLPPVTDDPPVEDEEPVDEPPARRE